MHAVLATRPELMQKKITLRPDAMTALSVLLAPMSRLTVRAVRSTMALVLVSTTMNGMPLLAVSAKPREYRPKLLAPRA
jgi:hypothetical protein